LLKVSILICTYGEVRWQRLAMERALPSAENQGAHEVRAWHMPGEAEPGQSSLSVVRNTAARDASGDVLCFLDADDELEPGYLDAMRETRSQRDRDALLIPWVRYIHGRRVDEPILPGLGRPLIELNRAVIGSLVPRDLFLNVGGFGEEPIYEDWDLWLRCSQHLELVDVPKAVYRVHADVGGRNMQRAEQRRWYDEIRARYEACFSQK
jgi:glycosyltransferase involved in cell wall biosynthesis